MANSTLRKAQSTKNDEFYTQLVDIEHELRRYKKQFRSKIVLCNCDDPYESNFFKYFANNFNHLGLKKLIATSYNNSPIAGIDLPLFQIAGAGGKQPIKIEITEVPDADGNGATGLSDVRYLLQHDANTSSPLVDTGDFRSGECVELLREADIVVTNPPFSLFRDFIALLMEHDKQFLIIAPDSALHYKEVFKLIKSNKLWLGYNRVKQFLQPDGTIKKFGNIGWLTNLDTTKRHEILPLYKKYSPEEYPRYNNLDAIDVKKTAEIPYDYDGLMGVPDAFLDKFNPDQFEIIGIPFGNLGKEIGVTKNHRGRTDIALTVDGQTKSPYSRIIIRKRQKA